MGTYSTSERTRQAIIHAAGELVAERGVGRVSTRAIAERAGENLGSIHYHFGCKAGLFKEMLRYACRSGSRPPLSEVIEPYMDRLHDPQAQAEVVRSLVGHLVQATLSYERPRWCSRVVYHVLQHAGPLRDYLREQTIDPAFEAMTKLFHAIRPDWTYEEAILCVHVMVGSIVFHADHVEIILDRLGSDFFPADYLARLEQRLAADALRALGLPDGEYVSE